MRILKVSFVTVFTLALMASQIAAAGTIATSLSSKTTSVKSVSKIGLRTTTVSTKLSYDSIKKLYPVSTGGNVTYEACPPGYTQYGGECQSSSSSICKSGEIHWFTIGDGLNSSGCSPASPY